MGKPASRIPELIRDWAEIAAEVLADSGVGKERSQELGLQVVRRVCEAYAGQQFYMPVWLAMRITERDRKIATEVASGRSPDAVAKTYQLHLTTVYAICRRVAAAELAERQQTLFADD
ncbi:Mor transcription activator family protein [Pinirhizobacter sp.]|jgi:Mor family transcriptional regulator|uniref:Mor transcription activator family protein n=1 Tax=Pinirhizobacter sp. TaxID=2950432 RepID=UPI002F42E10B